LESFASPLGLSAEKMDILKRAPLEKKCKFMIDVFELKAQESNNLITCCLSYKDIKEIFFELINKTWGIDLLPEEKKQAINSFRFYSKGFPQKILFKEMNYSNTLDTQYFHESSR